MPVNDLIKIIKNAHNPPLPTEIAKLREHIIKHPDDVNEIDPHGLKACDYALGKPLLLAILAFEGKAVLPDNLPNPTLNRVVSDIKKEQLRRKQYHGRFHLHDMIMRSVPAQFIKYHCQYHRNQINETSLHQRNACHWAALQNKIDYLEILNKFGADFLAKDIEGKTPFDLATDPLVKKKIDEILKTTLHPNEPKLPGVTQDKKLGEQPEGFMLRVRTGVEELSLRMIRAMSPPRTRPTPSEHNEKRSISPPRNPEAFERHPRARANSLSPREKTGHAVTSNQQSPPRNHRELRKILSSEDCTVKLLPQSNRARSLSTGELEEKRAQDIISFAPKLKKKSIHFANDLPLPLLVPIEPISKVAAENAEQREIRSISTERLINIFKTDDLEQFLHYYQKRKWRPNDCLADLGRPFIIQAFISNAGRIFIFLLRQGADLNVSLKSGKTFINYILENTTLQRLNFLKEIQEVLSVKANPKKIKFYQDKLLAADKLFMKRLADKRFGKKTKTNGKVLKEEQLTQISLKYKASKDLVICLHDLCTSITDQGKTDVEKIRKCIIGLLPNKSRIIAAILNDFYVYLKKSQKLNLVFLIKEMILWDRFNACYRSKHFCDVTLIQLIKNMEADGLTDLATSMRDIVNLQYKIDHTLVRANAQIQTMLSICDAQQQEFSVENDKTLAEILRQLTAQFWHNFSVSELIDKAWQKDGSLLNSPNVVKQFSDFTKLANILTAHVLKQPSDNLKYKYISIYINAITELLYAEPIDLQSAKILLGALENHYLQRYMDAFLELNGSFAKLYRRAKDLLSSDGNFRGQRYIIHNQSKLVFPWLGLYLRDLTLSAENSLSGRAEIEGQIFSEIIQIQNRIKAEYQPRPNSNLPHILHLQKELRDEDFELIAARTTLKPVNLFGMSLGILEEIIKAFCLKNTPITVIHEGRHEGLAAIDAMMLWLQDFIKTEKNVEASDLTKLFRRMASLPDARLKVHTCICSFKIWLKQEAQTNPKLQKLATNFVFDEDLEEATIGTKKGSTFRK